jgi:hypothetical protein
MPSKKVGHGRLQPPLNARLIDFGKNSDTDDDDDQFDFVCKQLKKEHERQLAAIASASSSSSSSSSASTETKNAEAETEQAKGKDSAEEESESEEAEDETNKSDEYHEKNLDLALFYEILTCVQKDVVFLQQVATNVHKMKFTNGHPNGCHCLKITRKNRQQRATLRAPIELRILSHLTHCTPTLKHVQLMSHLIITKKAYGYITPFVPALTKIEDDVVKWPHQKPYLIPLFMRQLFLAIQELHDHGVMHRDIKFSNILWNDKNQILTLADFGHATWITDKEHCETQVGTVGWIAPEIMERIRDASSGPRAYTEKCDMYSAGVVFGSLLFGVPEVMLEEYYPAAYRKEASALLPPTTAELLLGLLELLPAKRLSVKQALAHAYFTQV